ncbi:MAG: N-acetyltransferase [Spirochaetales bacterium]|nr:N-acetyltransferase [Spirochaetales bacterium]
MINPYEKCPEFESENFLLRLVNTDDTGSLLKVYSDKKAVPLFNSDNCHGDNFYYDTKEKMDKAIGFWLYSYEQKYFVRWAIVSKKTGEAVGTIELFNRQADDFFNNTGLLRLDLRSDYENADSIFEILSLIVPPTYKMFNCPKIATKIPPAAIERKTAAERLGFSASSEKLIGLDGTVYGDYYVLLK